MTLYVVATPIGNLKDITQRALDVLASVDQIAAEDTRHSGRLLSAYGIKTPMRSYHDFTKPHELEYFLTQLRDDAEIALISDAGTPLISDPGYRLVRAAKIEGIDVVSIPGVCALTAALSVSGLPCERFTFEGFIPSKQGARVTVLTRLTDEVRTMVFYEAPRRLPDSLLDLMSVFGERREAVIAREMTKQFETVRLGSLRELLDWVNEDAAQLKGECVLMVSGCPEVKQERGVLSQEAKDIATALAAELPPKKAALLTAQIAGVHKKDVYDWLVA
ncbi:MAG: 16S rRNA (cytidine(1402)-2'-O)-methyltransferase [Pseudomonadota bacterium]